jgi:uncharacterized protein YjbI with pentapeptide repeats
MSGTTKYTKGSNVAGARLCAQHQQRAAMTVSPCLPRRSSRQRAAAGPSDTAALRRRSRPFVYFVYFVVTLLLNFVPAAHAQRAFSLTLAPTNQNFKLSWKVQSATPVGDLVVLPQFRVERSLDLKTWTPISGTMTGTLNQTLSATDSNVAAGFYRVQSMIEKPYATMNNAKLNSGQLTGANFFGAQLFHALLVSAQLNGANLSSADLRTADLTGADLRGADMFNANALLAVFSSADLSGVDASFSSFEAADLFNADLTGADFSFSILTGANGDFATWTDVTIDQDTIMDPKMKLVWQIVNQGIAGLTLTNKDLSVARFPSVNFSGGKMNGSDFSASFLTGGDLRGASFSNANMRFVDFTDTQIDGATILDSKSRLVWQILNQNFGAGRDLHGTNLSSVFLVNANFVSANLSNVVCSLSICEEANFGGADLSRGTFSSADFFGAILTNANLTLANFSQADLSNANLLNANTNGTIFSGATFSNTIMPDGSIRNF